MSSPKLFFSYSRLDSDFALRLAKDIRRAGVDIWIDQLDRPVGHHWVAAVVMALIESSCVLVILSPSSTASNNVKDEISFALDTGKKIIPVLLKECLAPFRLHRLQHIDFSKEYDGALQQLLSTIKRSTHITAKSLQTAGGEEDILPTKDEWMENADEKLQDELSLWDERQERLDHLHAQSIPKKHAKPSSPVKKIFSRTNAIIAASVLALAIFWGFAASVQPTDDEDQKAWKIASVQMDSVSMVHYLKAFPNGKYSHAAKQILDSFKLAQQLGIDSLHTCLLQDSLAALWLSTNELNQQADSLNIKGGFTQDPAKANIPSTKTKTKTVIKSKVVSPYTIGQSFQGGKIVYINETGRHGLIVCDKDLGSFDYTTAMKRCLGFKFENYDDWRLPTRTELNWIYKNRKMVTGITPGMYWSTSTVNTTTAWTQDLTDGHTGNFNMGMNLKARAVRSF
jgi:hypothetical protein